MRIWVHEEASMMSMIAYATIDDVHSTQSRYGQAVKIKCSSSYYTEWYGRINRNHYIFL